MFTSTEETVDDYLEFKFLPARFRVLDTTGYNVFESLPPGGECSCCREGILTQNVVIRVNAGGIGRNGVRIGTPSQSLQSPQGTKQQQQQRISTPPGKEKTPALLVRGGGGAGSASLTPSPKKAETTSRKAEKELSLAAAENATTAKPVRGAQGGHSISIGQHHKQNGSSAMVLLATSEKFKVAGDDDDSCSLTSSDKSTTPLQPGQSSVSTLLVAVLVSLLCGLYV
jgi:hypothetical protein